jgi:hypothetical protein
VRLQLILPRVGSTDMNLPRVCPYAECQGGYFRQHQQVDKTVKDTHYASVSADRYECLRCQQTFRVYPRGVTQAQTSQRVKGLGVLLYLLGLSYEAMSLALEALGDICAKPASMKPFKRQRRRPPPRSEAQGSIRWASDTSSGE